MLPLASLPLPQDPCSCRGPRWAEDQPWDLSRLLGAQEGRGNLATLPFDPLPSQWSPSFPLRSWDPFPFPSLPSGAPGPSCLCFSSPLTPPHAPRPTWSLGVPPIPLGGRGPHRCLVGALVVWRHEFHILLVCHLDFSSQNFNNAYNSHDHYF